MPEWMEPFRPFFRNTGGNSIEDLIHRLDTEPNLSLTNLPAFALAVAAESQVSMLIALHGNGMLHEDHPDPRQSGPGAADAALSAEGAPAPAAGAPAQDPDAPPYASPFAYRAEPHGVYVARRWVW